jgi:hypothetical protein
LNIVYCKIFSGERDHQSPGSFKENCVKKAKTETVVPAPVPEAEPVPVPEPEPAPAEEPVVNDMTLGFSPEQTDSLLAAWRERQRQDAFSEFFKQYILEDSTEVADSMAWACPRWWIWCWNRWARMR